MSDWVRIGDVEFRLSDVTNIEWGTAIRVFMPFAVVHTPQDAPVNSYYFYMADAIAEFTAAWEAHKARLDAEQGEA